MTALSASDMAGCATEAGTAWERRKRSHAHGPAAFMTNRHRTSNCARPSRSCTWTARMAPFCCTNCWASV